MDEMLSDATAEQKTFKVELIQANLEIAITFAKLALHSDDEREIITYKQKACDSYEEALHFLDTATLAHIQFETIRTNAAHVESLLILLGEKS